MNTAGGCGVRAGPPKTGAGAIRAGSPTARRALTHDLVVKAGNRIADEISLPDEGYTVTAFNSLSWGRTEVVRAPLRIWQPHSSPMHIVPPSLDDEGPKLVLGGAIGRGIVSLPTETIEKPFELEEIGTGKRAPYQIVRTTDPQATVPWAAEGVAVGGMTELVFLADDLPAMGYKTYKIVPRDEWATLLKTGVRQPPMLWKTVSSNWSWTLTMGP